jgi:hypothetical protein
MTCPECKGVGKYHGLTAIEDCRACGGSGEIGDSMTLPPTEVTAGQVLVSDGKGGKWVSDVAIKNAAGDVFKGGVCIGLGDGGTAFQDDPFTFDMPKESRTLGFFHNGKTYTFAPRDDITAKEAKAVAEMIAAIFRRTIFDGIEDAVASCGLEVRRHFKPV